MRIRAGCLVLWLVCSLLSAQGITLVPPPKPIKPEKTVKLQIIGLTEVELYSATISAKRVPEVDPETITLGGSLNWQRIPFVEFSAEQPGTYTVTVVVNGWGTVLTEALQQAERAAVPPNLLDPLRSAIEPIALAYPAKSGTAVVEVAGVVVPFPPDPNTPPLPPSPNKVTRVTFVYEKDLHPLPRPVSSALQKLNAGGSSGVVASAIDDDVVDGMGQVPDQYKIAIDAARTAGLPALVIQAGATVLRVIKNPITEAHVLDAVK